MTFLDKISEISLGSAAVMGAVGFL